MESLVNSSARVHYFRLPTVRNQQVTRSSRVAGSIFPSRFASLITTAIAAGAIGSGPLVPIQTELDRIGGVTTDLDKRGTPHLGPRDVGNRTDCYIGPDRLVYSNNRKYGRGNWPIVGLYVHPRTGLVREQRANPRGGSRPSGPLSISTVIASVTDGGN